MANKVTVDEFLDRGEDAIKYELLEWGRKLTSKQLPASIRVLYRTSYQGATQTVLDLPVAERIESVTPIIDEIRKALAVLNGGSPLVDGVLSVRAATNGNKDNPEVNRSRRLCAPDAADLAEVAWLRSELTQARSWCQFLQTQLLEAHKGSQGLVGTLSGQLQALATTRAATTSMADVSPVHLLLGAIVLPVLLPRINKIVGLSASSPIDRTFSRVQALGSAQLEKLIGTMDEPEPVAQGSRTVLELVDGPAAVPAGAAAETTESAAAPVPAGSEETPPRAGPAWPSAEVLVARMVEDEAFRESMFDAMLGSPPALAMLRGKMTLLSSFLQ